MMTTWYSSPERIAALDAEVTGWLGTPFRENSAVRGPGGGVSCHNLAAELYFESGFIPRREVPWGRARIMLHRDPTELIARLDTFFGAAIAAIEPSESPLPGDLLIIQAGRIPLHLGTVVGNRQFAHVLREVGVMRSPLDDTTYKIAAIRRPRP